MYYSVSKYNKNLLHCKFYGDMMQHILQKNKKNTLNLVKYIVHTYCKKSLLVQSLFFKFCLK